MLLLALDGERGRGSIDMQGSWWVRVAGLAGTVAASLLLAGCASEAPEEEGAAADEAYLDRVGASWAEYYGISDPPQVGVVRFIGTEEVDTVHRECVLGAGFEKDEVGLIRVPEGQESTFALAEYTCRMQYPVAEDHTREWGDDQVRAQYAWTVGFVVPCLEAEGHPITGIPSESVFVETWESDPFYPFAQVRIEAEAARYNDAWAAIEAQCPQIVPGDVLWEGVTIEEWAERTR
ncbi:hypothetical protein G3H63_01800 [Microbacterium resistens]|uniref:hypothetical protein n=1 Tax=Microbacterium resistens TaxID=156977 RepID=UPI001C573731|nr:hypothetical protein [Microbacterium resistens]MBW1637821.1 hypothetical protein [Microbacterium resistens]